MLIWVTALHCEAKPVIDHYRLRKSHAHHAFDVYQSDQIECIVTGIGKSSAAAATAWIAALNNPARSIAWINLGTAGSANHDIGSALLVNKITDSDSNQNYYPVPAIRTDLPGAHCHSMNKPTTEYLGDQIYDMEASAFFKTATRFSSAELVQSIKVVSDNPTEQIGKNKSRVSEIINAQIKPVVLLAEALQHLNNKLAGLDIDDTARQNFLAKATFSQTQQSQLSRSLRYLQSQGFQLNQLDAQTSELESARQIIAHLDALCVNHSRNL